MHRLIILIIIGTLSLYVQIKDHLVVNYMSKVNQVSLKLKKSNASRFTLEKLINSFFSS